MCLSRQMRRLMNKETEQSQKKQMVPDLRFREFEGELKKYNLSQLTKINQGLQIAISKRFTEKINNSFFYITNEFLREKSNKAYYIVDPPKSVICSESDILMTRTGNTGQVVTNVSGAFHNNFFKINYDKEKLDKNYLITFLKLYKTQCMILRYAGTSTIPDLNHSDFYRLEIFLPKLREQQKIANFLTAIDQRISLLKQKKAALEQYKKGLMQKIFSQEIRFSDDEGNDFPDWVEKKLGSIGTFLGGGTPSTSKHKYWQGDIPWVSSSDVEENSVNDLTISRYISKEAIKNSATKIVPKNSLLIVSRVGIGKLAVTKQSICTSQDFSNFTPKNDDAYFLGYLLLFNKNKLLSVAQGTSIKGFTNNDLKSLKLKIPCKEEQQKIADFLPAIDQSINQLTNQIDQTTQFKKGLLQRMFV